MPGERALLMYLISKFQLLDPDVIVVSRQYNDNHLSIFVFLLCKGHDMRMFGLELFLSRCQKLKVGLTASKIGRLHRTHDGKTKVRLVSGKNFEIIYMCPGFHNQKSNLWSSSM